MYGFTNFEIVDINVAIIPKMPMEEHPNIVAINLMKQVETTRRLKKKTTSRLMYLYYNFYRAYVTGNILFKICINCQMY